MNRIIVFLILILISPIFFLERADALSVQETIEKDFVLGNNGNVTLKNISGDIVIHSSNEDKVKMVATKYAETLLESKAKEFLQEIQIETTLHNNQLDILTHMPAASFLKMITTLSIASRVEYELWVPLHSTISVELVSGSIRLDALEGNVNFKTVSGNINIDKIKGNANAKSVSGDLELKAAEGVIQAETTSGQIHTSFTMGSINLRTISGGIHAQLTQIDTSVKEINISSTSGDIILSLPEDLSADVEASTLSGNIRTELQLTIKGDITEGRKLRGTFGQGGLPIRLKTISGDISIQKLDILL